MGKRREKVVARQVTIALANRYCVVSLAWVCKLLGYADHTPSVYAKKRVQQAFNATKAMPTRLAAPDPTTGPAIRDLYRACERRIIETIETRDGK
jgi:hypothetical protein